MKYLKQYSGATNETYIALVPDETTNLVEQPTGSAEEISQATFKGIKKTKVGLKMLGEKSCCVLYKLI